MSNSNLHVAVDQDDDDDDDDDLADADDVADDNDDLSHLLLVLAALPLHGVRLSRVLRGPLRRRRAWLRTEPGGKALIYLFRRKIGGNSFDRYGWIVRFEILVKRWKSENQHLCPILWTCDTTIAIAGA